MSDIISRQAAIEVIDAVFPVDPKMSEYARGIACGAALAKTYVKQLPSTQPERKRGKWNITDAYPHNVYCSECNTRFAQTHWAVWEDGSLPRNFCPNCGAYMGGKKDEVD